MCVVWSLLLVVCCLFVVGCWSLLVDVCWLLVVGRCLLFVVWFVLFFLRLVGLFAFVRCPSLVGCCSFVVVCCLVGVL